MARPRTKEDLMIAANNNFEKMYQLLDSMTEEVKDATFNFGDDPKKKEAHWKRDKNVRDVLIHLYEWHQLLLKWIEANKKGDRKPFLPEPYGWKTYGTMNVMFWEKNQLTSFETAKAQLIESHKKVMDVIESYSNEELFENQHFNWTGTSCVGSYCVSVTSSHYDWAIKKLKLHIKTCK